MGFHWAAVGTLATTGVAAVGAWVGVRQRRLDRQRPNWRDFTQSWQGFGGLGARDADGNDADLVRCTIVNIGDGAAYGVKVRAGLAETYPEDWPLVERAAR